MLIIIIIIIIILLFSTKFLVEKVWVTDDWNTICSSGKVQQLGIQELDKYLTEGDNFNKCCLSTTGS